MTLISADSRKFQELKAEALDLLEWALKDMSPANGPQLHLRCGFEREGSFLPEMQMLPKPSKNWEENLVQLMEKYADIFYEKLKDDPRLEKI